ncbi:MAG: hypothetical protein MJ237_06255 [bacterium]|nr:hypothetical protein [bacterium]
MLTFYNWFITRNQPTVKVIERTIVKLKKTIYNIEIEYPLTDEECFIDHNTNI